LKRSAPVEAWQNYLRTDSTTNLAYQYDLADIKPLAPETTNGQSKPLQPIISEEINVRGQKLGELSIAESPDLPLTREDRDMIRAVADRVSLTLENLRLVEQTRNALSRVEQLYETSRSLSGTTGLNEAFQVAAGRLSNYPAVDRVIIYVGYPTMTPDTPYMQMAYIWEREKSQSPSLRIGNYTNKAEMHPQMVNTSPYAPVALNVTPDLLQHDFFERLGVKSIAFTPLATLNRWFGVMVAHSNRSEAFISSEFQQFMGALADQLSNTIENRSLFDEAQTESRVNRALADAAQQMSQFSSDFETSLISLMRAVSNTANYTRWWYGQITLSSQEPVIIRVASGGEPDSLKNTFQLSLYMDASAIGEAARSGRPVMINDPLTRYAAAKDIDRTDIQTLGKHIALPVRSGNSVVGILLVCRDQDGDDFDDRDMRLALTIANQISVASENRRLYDAAARERSVLQTTVDSLPAGVAVLSPSGEMLLSNTRVRQLLGLDETVPYPLVATSSGISLSEQDLPFAKVMKTGIGVSNMDVSVLLPSGGRIDMLLSAVPMVREGRIGSVLVVYQDVSELRDLENTLQENLRQMMTLYEVTRSISKENELPNILKALISQVDLLIHPDHFYAVFNGTTEAPPQAYQMIMAEGEPTVHSIEDVNMFPSEILAQSTFTDSDLLTSDLASHPTIQALGMRSVITLPLSIRETPLGWLVIGFKEATVINSEQKRVLFNIADQTAAATQSAYLSEQTARSLSTTSMLYETTLNITRAESLEATLTAIREQALSFEPHYVDIFVVNYAQEGISGDWAVRFDAADPNSEEIFLQGAARLEDWEFISAPAYFIEDVKNVDADLQAHAAVLNKPLPIVSMVSLPMVKGRVLGRMVLGFTRKISFGRTEEQVMTALSDQGAIAIDNFLLVEQTQQTLDETSILYEASRAISNAASLQEGVIAVVNYAVNPQISSAYVMELLGENWEAPDVNIRVVAGWSSNPDNDMQGLMFTRDQLPFWDQISGQDVLWIEDLSGSEYFEQYEESAYALMGFQSMLVFPLSAGGMPLGALLFGSDIPWYRTEREQRIYKSVADLISISMERNRLLEQTRRRARQLEISAQIAQAASSILNLDELFNRIVELIKDSFEYDHAQIFRVQEGDNFARVVASTGEAGRQLLRIGHKLEVGSASVIGQVTKLGIVRLVSDTADRTGVHRPNPYLPETRSELALPLGARNRILGALDVQSNEPGRFTPDDVAVLATLANQIAIAIDNASLYETSEARAEEMRFLFDIARTGAAISETPEETLIFLAEMIRFNMKVNAACVLLLDDADRFLVPYAAIGENVTLNVAANYPFDTPFFRDFAETREPVMLNDVSSIRAVMETTSRLGQSSMLRQVDGLMAENGSFMMVPLIAGEKVVGAISLASTNTNAFSDDSLRLLQTMASTLSALVQNARLLREVQATNIRLLELDKLKNQFLANMSHELRTPLNSIIGFSRVILKGIDGPLTELQSQDLTTIYDSGRHLLGLVNDILDQAKIQSNKIDITFTQFSAAELVKGVMSTAIGLAKDKPVKLYTEIDPQLPLIWGDEFRTRQSLLNLISNAVKFTPEGSVTASAVVTEFEGLPFVRLSITDTGIGIPHDRLQSIFEPFQQVENSAARKYEGTGLGLPIAKDLVERMGGHMEVQSQLNFGSTFSIYMPVERPLQAIEQALDEEAINDSEPGADTDTAIS
jgi:GAF domain-containing protein